MARTAIAATMPLGMERAGSLASSAASGTHSTARKNQIAKGNAAHTPSRPKGSHSEAPAASVGAMSVRLAASKSGIAPSRKSTRPTTATAAMTIMTLSASPTPIRWMPMKRA